MDINTPRVVIIFDFIRTLRYGLVVLLQISNDHHYISVVRIIIVGQLVACDIRLCNHKLFGNFNIY